MLTEFSELLNRLAGMGDEMASFYRRLQDVPGDAFLDKKSMVDVRREYETHETQVGRIELEKSRPFRMRSIPFWRNKEAAWRTVYSGEFPGARMKARIEC